MREKTTELWFIFSTAGEEWSGLRIATFISTMDTIHEIVIIHNEMPDRLGPRVWDDIRDREKWVKVRRIEAPTYEDVRAAVRGENQHEL